LRVQLVSVSAAALAPGSARRSSEVGWSGGEADSERAHDRQTTSKER
jgi:hypothetical protein